MALHRPPRVVRAPAEPPRADLLPGPGGDAIARAVREERDRTRTWLHDHTLQLLELIAAGGYADEVDAERMRALAALAADRLRSWIEAPEPLAIGDLTAALAEVVCDTQLLAGSLAVELRIGPMTADVPAHHAAALAAAAREALTNVRRHAHARRAVVSCEATAAGVTVAVEDDGIGFDPERVAARTGLRLSLVGRMLAAGGSARVESRPGEGTRVTLSIGPAAPRLVAVGL